MTLSWPQRVEAVNSTFPNYPPTIYSHGWVYGVWYCSTTFQRASLYGEYPPTFLKRAKALFPDATRILHCPSGLVHEDVTVDCHITRHPHIVGRAESLPFSTHTFDLVLSDPPYSAVDAQHYDTGPYPLTRAMAEAGRVLKPGGYFGLLHTMYPSYQRKQGWKLDALIAVVTGFCKRTRLFSIFLRTQ